MASQMTDEARQRAGWTKARPTESGVYWLRDGTAIKVVEVEIGTFDGFRSEVVVWPGERKPSQLSSVQAEWFGPITPDDGDREYQRGLEAAANVVRAQAGGLTREACAGCGNEDDVAEGAANDALRYAADTLDRLAQEARR